MSQAADVPYILLLLGIPAIANLETEASPSSPLIKINGNF
jgi:hypothetical protein